VLQHETDILSWFLRVFYQDTQPLYP
jgi:hypothetical protein